ncbi:hypothetical protein GDO81_011449 [Engystomops pustulosus]|uniref:Uncharacterized protein n=1 Tax=Engystomops pustulosus TaxID=76066 RepID=A0AAV7BE29_ENGPU|nr:hypothetical protein GDO81_011449 [Engystomops pustulosus]
MYSTRTSILCNVCEIGLKYMHSQPKTRDHSAPSSKDSEGQASSYTKHGKYTYSYLLNYLDITVQAGYMVSKITFFESGPILTLLVGLNTKRSPSYTTNVSNLLAIY